MASARQKQRPRRCRTDARLSDLSGWEHDQRGASGHSERRLGRSCVEIVSRAIIRAQITEAEREHSEFGRLGGARFSATEPSAEY